MENLQVAFKMHKSAEHGKEGDSFLYRDNLFMVAEGVGGEYVSEIAQQRACRIIPESFFKHLPEVESPGYAIIHALRKANEEILNERSKLGRKMAVSVSVVYVRDRVMYFTHLGDSRIYCLQDGELNQLTRDHTLKEEDGFEKDRFRDPRLMKALTEGLGIHQIPSIKVKKIPLHQKDLILMTTEGLTTHVSNREILDLSSKTKDLEKLCSRLIDLANKKGGDGDMTVGALMVGIPSKKRQNIIITYSVLALLILSVLAGYALKNGGSKTDKEEPKAQQPIQEKTIPKKETKTDEKIIRPPDNQVKDVQPLKEAVDQPPEASLEDKIDALIGDWKVAWENTVGEKSNMDNYISFYSDDFNSKGLDKNGWKHDKESKRKNKLWIRIELSDIKISELKNGNQIEVRFLQGYKSSNYSEKTRKLLILNKEETGWKIVAERTY